MRLVWRSCVLGALLCVAAAGQRRVDPGQMYERAYLILPMVGKGTWADPKRPMLMPAPDQMKAEDRSGIIAFHFQPSDDGRFALVEVVAAKLSGLAPYLAQARVQQAAGAQLFDSLARRRGEVEQA